MSTKKEREMARYAAHMAANRWALKNDPHVQQAEADPGNKTAAEKITANNKTTRK